jgi:hypothetical protein
VFSGEIDPPADEPSAVRTVRLKDEPMKLNDHALHHATMAIDQKVPPLKSAAARGAREQAEWAENKRRWWDPYAEHWSPWPPLMTGITGGGSQKRG